MSDTQSKRLITWRVDPDLLARIDRRAKELDRSRSAFLVWACENALEDAGRGVPDVPKVPAPAKPDPKALVDDWQAWAKARQQKLNEAKERRG
jgi:hypothetical protein